MSDLEFRKRKAAAAAAALEAGGATPQPAAGPTTPSPAAASAPAEPEMFDPQSKSGAALRGFSQGASYGFGDELDGALHGAISLGSSLTAKAARTSPVRSVLRKMLPAGDGLPDEAFDKLFGKSLNDSSEEVLGSRSVDPDHPMAAASAEYTRGRDQARRDDDVSSDAHPTIHAASNFAGGIATPGPKLPAGGRLTTLSKRIIEGALMGGANAAGNSTADTGTGIVRDAALGGTVGAVLNPVLGAGGDKFSKWLKGRAEKNAVKAMHGAGISNHLANRGYETEGDVQELGRAALDSELIPTFGKAADIAQNAAERKVLTGQVIEDSLQSSASKRPDFDEMGWRAVQNVVGPDGLTPTAARQGAKAQKLVGDIQKMAEDPAASILDANRMKSDMYDGINFATEPKLHTRMQKDAVRGVKEQIEKHVRDVAGDDVADQLVTANKRYGQLSDIQSLAQDEASRQILHKGPTLTSIIGPAVLGATVGGGTGGAAGAGGGLAAYGLRKLAPMAPAFFSRAQDAASPLVAKAAPGVARMSALEAGRGAGEVSDHLDRQAQWRAVTADIATNGGQGLGKYAAAFRELSPDKWQALNEALMSQDPEYRAAVQNLAQR